MQIVRLAERIAHRHNKNVAQYWPIIVRTSLYVAAQFIQRAANLLLLPMLIATMSAEQFSRYGLLTTLFLLIGAALTLNIHLAPTRLIFDCTSVEEEADLLFTSLVGAIALMLLVSIVVIVFMQVAHVVDPVTQGQFFIQVGIIFCTAALRVAESATTVMQAEGKATLFLTVSVTRQLGLLIAYYLLSRWLSNAFIAFLLAFLISSLVSTIISLGYVGRRLLLGRFRMVWLQRAFTFAAPTAVHVVAIWVIQSSGRWIGTRYMPLEALAPYTLVTQIAFIVIMFSRAFFSARAPEIGQAFGMNKLRRGMQIINRTVLVSLPVIVIGYLVMYVILFIFNIPLPLDYRPTALLLFLAMLANLFDLWYLRGIQTLSALKKTHIQAGATVLASIFTVFISFPLAQYMADTGLILAMTLGYAAQALFSNLAAQNQLRFQEKVG